MHLDKIELLKTKTTEIKCDYTKMYLETAEETFSNYAESLTEEDDVQRVIGSKFIFDFETNQYSAFKKNVIAKFIERINA